MLNDWIEINYFAYFAIDFDPVLYAGVENNILFIFLVSAVSSYNHDHVLPCILIIFQTSYTSLCLIDFWLPP